MDQEDRRMRGDWPFVFTNLQDGTGLQQIIDFILHEGMLNQTVS